MNSNPSRIMIAGACGFIGRALYRYLELKGHKVWGVDRQPHKAIRRFQKLELLDEQAVKTALNVIQPNYVFHLAGLVGSDDETALHLAHVETTRVLLTAVYDTIPFAKIVLLGSAAEYGRVVTNGQPIPEGAMPSPDSLYGRSKYAQSELALELAIKWQLDLLRVRLFNTLGPAQPSYLVGGAMTARLVSVAQSTIPHLEVYDPFSERDFLDVRDVARLLWLVAFRIEKNPERPPIHLASGVGTSVLDLAKMLLRAANLTDDVSLRPVETGTPTRVIGDPTTLLGLLGNDSLQSYDIYRSLRDMWQWHLAYHDV